MVSSPSSAGGRFVLQGISVQTPLGPDTFIVRRFEDVEELGEPVQVTVDLETADTGIVAEPSNALLVTAPAKQPLGPGPLEVFDHPGLFQTNSDGDRCAEVRIKGLERRQRVYRGGAQCLGLSAGFTFSFQDSHLCSESGTSVTTTMKLTVGDLADLKSGRQAPTGAWAGSAYWYDGEVTAIPSSVQHRSRYSAVLPKVLALQTAFVYAPEGQDPQTPSTDHLGRIQPLFPWSRDGTQMAWVRKAPVMAGDGPETIATNLRKA